MKVKLPNVFQQYWSNFLLEVGTIIVDNNDAVKVDHFLLQVGRGIADLDEVATFSPKQCSSCCPEIVQSAVARK